jgi:hypothetical protein
MFKKQFSEVEDACALAQAIVDTVRELLIVLDKDLRAIAASRSFYVKFSTNPGDTRGKHFYELGRRSAAHEDRIGRTVPERGGDQ